MLNKFEVAPKGVAGVSGSVDGHAEGVASRSPRLSSESAFSVQGRRTAYEESGCDVTPNSQSIGLKPLSTRGSEQSNLPPADSEFDVASADVHPRAMRGKGGEYQGKVSPLEKSCHRVSPFSLYERTVSLLADREQLEVLRLEMIEAEREGGDIEHSGYPYAGESRY